MTRIPPRALVRYSVPVWLIAACWLSGGCDASQSGREAAAQGGGGSGGGGSSVAGSGGAASAGATSGGIGSGGLPTSNAGSGGSAGTTAGEGLLIDDFEDGDDQASMPGGWYGYTDSSEGGLSTLTFTGATGSAVAMNGPGYQSAKSLEVSYTFDKGTYKYDPYVGFGAAIGSSSSQFDATPYSGVSYTYQGGAHRLNVETTDVGDYDYFGIELPASTTWKSVNLPFRGISQGGWGAKATLDVAHVTNISFVVKGATGASGKLQIDNLRFEKTTSLTPDMTVQPVSPPENGAIDTIEITNPLQAKAMQYLNHGYNLTNWLEQERFSGFKYDEAFVEKLVRAGFRSLRLPIDLDLYVASKTGSGESLSLEVSSELFEVLDAFEVWTRSHGISLTIDYHHYNSLLDKSDPDSLATAVQLWGKVAEHFADSPREDLFFELLNEPELSFTGTDPTQLEWGSLAERMLAAIRSKDTSHTVIFGDVEWYGIEKLAAREPLADSNVIYAFHDYAPFIFTHQGASWANMGTTHDLPYPYAPERWSQYFADLGFNSAMEAWILSSARNYYRDGTRAALRNQVLVAKRWAVKHNVPVICNEFGAYDGTSRLEDRVRYYTDIVGIFDELAIPWQHWFMIMDENGNVLPEYRTAFGLSH